MYLDWARAIEEYQPLVTEEHRKRVCSHPAGDKSTALDLFENDVTGCLDTVFCGFGGSLERILFQCFRTLWTSLLLWFPLLLCGIVCKTGALLPTPLFFAGRIFCSLHHATPAQYCPALW